MLAKNLLNLHYFDFGKPYPKVTREAEIPTFPEEIPQMEILSAAKSAKNISHRHTLLQTQLKQKDPTALYTAVSVHGTNAHFTAQALPVRATIVTPFLTFHKNTHVKYKT